MRVVEKLNTDRLVLRRLSLDDSQAIFDVYASDPDVTQYLTWAPYKEIGPLRKFVADRVETWGKDGRYAYAIEEKESRRLMGSIEMRIDGCKASFGYVLGKSWGHGFMPEALRSLVDVALSQDGVCRAGAVCDVENKGSARVMEKAGMTKEGTLRKWLVAPNVSPVPRDCFVYSKVRD